MNTKRRKLTRRDRCWLVGIRASLLSDAAGARAWMELAARLQSLENKDVPKFDDLLGAVRSATIAARR